MYLTLSALFFLVKTAKRFDGIFVTFVNNWSLVLIIKPAGCYANGEASRREAEVLVIG
jgi:hypothetical protein